MKIGDKVRIVKCDVCPKIVNKTAEITEIMAIIKGSSLGEYSSVTKGKERIRVKFGKGRPQLNRPNTFACEDITLVEEDVNG